MNESISFKVGIDSSQVTRGLLQVEREVKAASRRLGQIYYADQPTRLQQQIAAILKSRTPPPIPGTPNVPGGHGLPGGLSSGAYREGAVIMRELAAGNFTGALRSFSVLLGSVGKLGRAVTMLVNPVTGVVLGAAAGTYGVYRMGINAWNARRNARDMGFSLTGYQGLQMQAASMGEGAAAMGGAQNLHGMLARLSNGDVGAVQAFRRWGISLTNSEGQLLNTEAIYKRVIDRISATADESRRAAMGMEFFGSNYQNMRRTIEQGSEGLDRAKKAQLMGTGDNAVLANMGEEMRDKFEAGKRGASRLGQLPAWLYSRFLRGKYPLYQGFSFLYGKDYESIYQGSLKNEELDRQRVELEARWIQRFGPRKINMDRLRGMNPQLALELEGARTGQEIAARNISDRGRDTLDSLAEQGRAFTGQIHRRVYRLTPRMQYALKIKDLEEQAIAASTEGNDALSDQLTKQALQMREAAPWLKRMDQKPLEEAERQLRIANEHLLQIEQAARAVLAPLKGDK